MSPGARWTLFALALVLSLTLYLKGRLPAPSGREAAFFPPPAGSVTVRLAGAVPRPGLYRLPLGTPLVSAIKMTVPRWRPPKPAPAALAAPVQAGDVITLEEGDGKSDGFSVTKMPTRERMLLGIPLHPDLLDAEEWALLPGIGPVLAQRIVDDRHKNGAFGSLQGLLRVPGIGPGRLAALKKYF